ncbi:hypothetical protein OG301_30095 [Streptomyces platensis]|nr:hypothetical protein OG229_08660 [Streptomyces platensis]WTI55273.1 hypothetical protein OG301_30095 [Streptomyces platensis]WUB79144.1 hypothetical protein OG424_08165 [Streptomyces platensis]
MANTKGAKAVVIGIGALGTVAALAVLWIFSVFASLIFGWPVLGA